MTSNRRIIALSVVAVVLVVGPFAVFANGSQESKSGSAAVPEMVWSSWGNPGETQRFVDYTDVYNKAHSDTHWTFVPIPNDQYVQKLQTELAGGTAPDFFYINTAGMVVSTLANSGLLQDLTPLLGTGDYPHKQSDWPSELMQGVSVNGKVYALPPDVNPMLMYYNKTVLKQAGITDDPNDLFNAGKWTWDEFAKLCAQVKAAGMTGYIQDNWWGPLYSWVWVNGGSVYTSRTDAKATWIADTNPQSIQAFSYLTTNLQNGNFVYAGSLPKGQADDAAFVSNQVAFVEAGRWYAPEFNTAKISYDVVPWPSPSGKMMPTAIAIAFVGISGKTKYPDRAWKFMDDYISDPGVKFRLSNGGNAIAALLDPALQKEIAAGAPAHSSYFFDLLKIGHFQPVVELNNPGINTNQSSLFDVALTHPDQMTDTLKKVGDAVKAGISQ